MIIRDIAIDHSLIESFDWFNDYKDTRRWLIHSYPCLLPRFDDAYLKSRQQELLDRNAPIIEQLKDDS